MSNDRVVDKSGWSYTIIENDLIEATDLDIYEKMLYISLKRFANLQSHEAFPGVKRLAQMSGMSERKARTVIGDLNTKKYIDVSRRTNNTSIYTILPSHARGAVGHAHGAGGVVHTVHEGGAPGADELKKQELKKDELKKDNDIVVNTPIQNLFNHYLSKNIINHNNFTGSMKTAVNGRLKDYTYEQLVEAIDNYSVIYHSNDYWFNTKYGFADLMRDKDIRKFINDADPLKNFATNDIKKRGGNNGIDRRCASKDVGVQSAVQKANERRRRLSGIKSDRNPDDTL